MRDDRLHFVYYGLALRLSARCFFNLLLIFATGARTRALGSGLLARGALYLLAFEFVFDFTCIGHKIPLSISCIRIAHST